jgi:hypothetical protein
MVMEIDTEYCTFEEKFVAALMPQINTDIYKALIKYCIETRLISRVRAEDERQSRRDLDELIHTNLKILDLLLSIDEERIYPSTLKDYQLEKRFKIELVAKEIAKKRQEEVRR